MKVCVTCGHGFESSTWTCPRCGWAPGTHDTWPVFAPDLADGDDGISPESFAALARLEAGHFWFRARNRLLVWAMRTYFPDASTFLEVGCGTGFVLTGLGDALPRLALAGSEVRNAGLAFARSRLPNVGLFQTDARRLPFAEQFDVIGAFDVLEHIEDDAQVLAEFFRATRPGGGIVITVPQHRWLWSVVDERALHRRRYARSDLVRKVERAGFQVVRTTSFVSALLPVVWLARFIQNRRGFGACEEFDVSPRTNALLERIMDAERAVIGAGASLPVGASLLLVARRAVSG
jgi:SAM-dependent methyltransferase